jgi:hypothetical protein
LEVVGVFVRFGHYRRQSCRVYFVRFFVRRFNGLLRANNIEPRHSA